MNKALVIFILVLSIGSISAYYHTNTSTEAVNCSQQKVLLKPFDIKLKTDKVNDNEYSLSATIELNEGDYIISPFSTDSIYGNFSMMIAHEGQFAIDKMLLETPKSVPEMDPITNKSVRFVRTNTTYQQQLEVLKQDDFEVSGIIEFVLEPSCVPYDVSFLISFKNGEMKVKTTKIAVSKEYKL